MPEYDKVTQASLNGLYVKAAELDRGQNKSDAPVSRPAGAVGNSLADDATTVVCSRDALSHSSDAQSHASDANPRECDVQTHVSEAYTSSVDMRSHVGDAQSHASDAQESPTEAEGAKPQGSDACTHARGEW